MLTMPPIMRGLLQKCNGLFSVSLFCCLIAFHAIASAPVSQQAKPEASPHSLKALRAHIAELRAKQREGEEKRGEKGEKKVRGKETEEGGLDYLEALEAYLSIRA